VKRQTLGVEETSEKLRRAIADKENPMKLAQTRLEGRMARPSIELCRDGVVVGGRHAVNRSGLDRVLDRQEFDRSSPNQGTGSVDCLDEVLNRREVNQSSSDRNRSSLDRCRDGVLNRQMDRSSWNQDTGSVDCLDQVLDRQEMNQSRSDWNRSGVARCRDGVQYRLVEEVTIIGESVDKLREALAQAEAAAKALRRQQLEIEEDLAVKANSLYVDETECAGIRRSINIQTY